MMGRLLEDVDSPGLPINQDVVSRVLAALEELIGYPKKFSKKDDKLKVGT
jgi:hypothetical protein